MRIALFGLPQCGKSTIFQLLTGLEKEEPQYDNTGTPKPQIGTVDVLDERIDFLASIYNPSKKVYPQVEYLDPVGLKFGDVKENRLLAYLRQIDLLAHVVRSFKNESVFHPEGNVSIRRDILRMESELMLADLIIIDGRVERLKKSVMKSKNPEDELQLSVLEKLKESLESEVPIRNLKLTTEEKKSIQGFGFLSQKPLQIIVNLDETEIKIAEELIRDHLAEIEDRPSVKISYLSGLIELEISKMPPEEAKEFMNDYGISSPGTDRLIEDSFNLLRLISFLTIGKDECRSWPIPIGSTALQAAGAIHTDFQRGFISAQIVDFETFRKNPNEAELKKQGLMRLEGKDYIVKDGDIIEFRFNV